MELFGEFSICRLDLFVARLFVYAQDLQSVRAQLVQVGAWMWEMRFCSYLVVVLSAKDKLDQDKQEQQSCPSEQHVLPLCTLHGQNGVLLFEALHTIV